MKYDGLVTSCTDNVGGDVEVWVESMRRLKPGSAVLVHVQDKTAHLTAIALRRAGFERRDTLFFNTGGLCSLVLFYRAPLEESAVVQQVIATGTGAINIDATRIKGIVPMPTRTRTYRRFDNKYKDKDSKGNGPVLDLPPEPLIGRWPPNYIFRHGPECRKAGTVRYRDIVIDKYECFPPCLVPNIERQSKECGVLGSKTAEGHADDGAAARFFTQLSTDEDLSKWLKTLACPPDGKLFDPFS